MTAYKYEYEPDICNVCWHPECSGDHTPWTPESGQKQCLPIPYPTEDDE